MGASTPIGRERSTAEQSDRPPATSLVQATRRGIRGGVIATVVMTVYRLPVFRALPPTAEFWARYVGGGDAEQYPLVGLVLHVCYGAGAGGVFGPVFATVDRKTDLGSERLGLVAGLAYGLVLSVVGQQIVVRRVLDQELADDEVLVFHVGHVIYGLTLGTWFGTREEYGEVYE